MTDLATEREKALAARRDELEAIMAAGRAAEAELRALDVEFAKADEMQPDPYTVATQRAIEEHRPNEADARAVMCAREMARSGDGWRRDRTKRS